MKDILLIFLSDIKVKDNAIIETEYKNLSGEKTHCTNESAVRYVLERGTTLDKIFILASKRVREVPAFNGKTSLQYFTERIGKFTAAEIVTYPYDEEKSSGAENLKCVAGMAGSIQDFAQDCGDKVTLHVDLTGGMRQVNTIMLDVTRLLEYSGIKIGKILYSNYQTRLVEEVKDIYDLFQLIAGVEEFVRFGSVKALNDYYEGKTLSPALKKLVDAMGNFAEEIKLCHYGQLQAAIENLHDAVHDFEPNQNDAQDLLMARLIGRIRKDYESIISNRKRDDLTVIQWCVDNGYMQQALTLYTERIPEYLGENGFITQSEVEAEKLRKELAKDEMHRERWFYLLNECKPSGSYPVDEGLTEFGNALKKDAMPAITRKNFNYDVWWENLRAQLEQLNIYCVDEPRLRRQLELLVALKVNPRPLLQLSAPELNPLRAIIDELSSELENFPRGFERLNQIIQFVSHMQKDEVKNFFPPLVFATPNESETVLTLANKFPYALKCYRMIGEEIFSIKVPDEEFFSIMDRYFRIKFERNNTNHAHVKLGEFPTATALKDAIEKGIAEIGAAKKHLNTEATHE